jgi:hypothetical protein
MTTVASIANHIVYIYNKAETRREAINQGRGKRKR